MLHFRYYKSSALITVVLTIGGVVYLFNEYVIGGIGGSLSAIGTITLIIQIIDSYLWKYPPFKWLFWMPNIAGRYEGFIEYRHPIMYEWEEKHCIVEVIQTGSKIKLNSFFQKSDEIEQTFSKSLVESIIKNDDDSFSIVFTYQNKGMLHKFPFHSGTNILNIIERKEGITLKGYYYTNREPQTKGKMEVNFTSKQIQNDY